MLRVGRTIAKRASAIAKNAASPLPPELGEGVGDEGAHLRRGAPNAVVRRR